MKDENKLGKNEETKELDEGALEEISGGSYGLSDFCRDIAIKYAEGIAAPDYYIESDLRVGSHDIPEFHVGQKVMLYETKGGVWHEFEVESVSAGMSGGKYKQWTYDLVSVERGIRVCGVQENCIKAKR